MEPLPQQPWQGGLTPGKCGRWAQTPCQPPMFSGVSFSSPSPSSVTGRTVGKSGTCSLTSPGPPPVSQGGPEVRGRGEGLQVGLGGAKLGWG